MESQMDTRTEILKLELVKGLLHMVETVKQLSTDDVQKLMVNTIFRKVEIMFPSGEAVGEVLRYAISIQSLNPVP
jgi:hypothetical protein